MKKRTIIIIFLLIIIISVVLACTKITGYIVEERGNCIDSDNSSFYLYKGENSFYLKGSAKYENRDKIYTDYCVRGAKLKEYYCTHGDILRSVKARCSNGCVDGACIK